MADEANPNLRQMTPDARTVWMRQLLVRLPGDIVEIDGQHWKVLLHRSAMPSLLADLSNGLLTHPMCRDLNARLAGKGWRKSEAAEHNSHQQVHRVLILPEDGLIPASPDDKPITDAEPAERVDPEADELGVEDLEQAARVMRWAASMILTLQNRRDELETENKELRAQLTEAQQQLDAAEAAERERPRPDAKTVLLFRDGVNKLSGLQEP